MSTRRAPGRLAAITASDGSDVPAGAEASAGPARHGATGTPRRVLALVARFKSSHIDYLHALASRARLTLAWSGEARPGVAATAAREGLAPIPVGSLADTPVAEVRRRLAQAVDLASPEVVHIMYYRHEALVGLVREICGPDVAIVFECRDPLTTLERALPGSPPWRLEAAALRASDGQILVSDALRSYLERSHALDLSASSIVVPHAFAARTAGVPQPKLSDRDGRPHLALVGTADPRPDHDRYYLEMIRCLVGQGIVVHGHFHRIAGVDLEPYERLAAELGGGYLHEEKVPYREGTRLSAVISRYDLMGVFHRLDATLHNESATLAVCMPTKAVCGWLHGAIPIVCFPHYRGLVELVERLGIGFVVDRLDEVGAIAADRSGVQRAAAATLAVRERFTHEYQAARIAAFYEALRSRSGASG
jgi:hypothetical protein